MNVRRMTVVAVALAVAVVAGAPAAWAQKKQAKSIEEMGAFREQVEAIKNQIDPVLSALNGIVQSASADPLPAFKTFSKETDKMMSEVDKARKMRAEMKKKGEALFAEWEKKMGAITNEAIKAKAQANRAKLQELYASIEPDIAAAKETGESFLNDLKDLQAYFGVDLSSSGIASMADTITKSNADGQAIKGMLDKVLATLDQVKAQLAPGGTGQAND